MIIKITNFNLMRITGSRAIDYRFTALVDVTTKKGFFGKRITDVRAVHKKFGGAWYFVDNGQFTPGCTVDELARGLEAENGKDLEHCLD